MLTVKEIHRALEFKQKLFYIFYIKIICQTPYIITKRREAGKECNKVKN